MNFTPRTLYFLYSPHCGVCGKVEPEFDTYLREHPTVFGFKVNIHAPNPSPVARIAKGETPVYVLSEGGEIIWRHAGGLTAKDLKRQLERLD